MLKIRKTNLAREKKEKELDAKLARLMAIEDYNIMMGIIDDPKGEDHDEI